MKSWLRTIGAFFYAAIISSIFLFLSAYVIPCAIVYFEGFWETLSVVIGILIVFLWLSEKGVEYSSIPFNYLWDKTFKTRVATVIPVVLIGLWCLSLPFRISLKFSVGDWFVVVAWEICAVFFYFNMFLLPFNNPTMGVGCKKDN